MKKLSLLAKSLIGTLSCLFVIDAAQAVQIIPPPGTTIVLASASFEANSGPYTAFSTSAPVSESYSVPGSPYYLSGGAATTAYPNPGATAYGGGYGLFGGGNSMTTFQFAVVENPGFTGPPGMLVPVDVNAMLLASGLGPTYTAKANISVSGASGNDLVASVCNVQAYGTPLYTCPGNGNISTTLLEVPNTPITVGLGALAGSNNGSATASADPSFFIDPSFALAQDYSIILSPGIGNPAPVPEPGEWALMLSGIGLLGFIATRRETVAS